MNSPRSLFAYIFIINLNLKKHLLNFHKILINFTFDLKVIRDYIQILEPLPLRKMIPSTLAKSEDCERLIEAFSCIESAIDYEILNNVPVTQEIFIEISQENIMITPEKEIFETIFRNQLLISQTILKKYKTGGNWKSCLISFEKESQKIILRMSPR
jgi:hypothetical protein